LRRRRARLPDLHVDDLPARRFQFRRRRQHIHGKERLDLAPRRRSQHARFNITCVSFVAQFG
jgi:hypothetical protein